MYRQTHNLIYRQDCIQLIPLQIDTVGITSLKGKTYIIYDIDFVKLTVLFYNKIREVLIKRNLACQFSQLIILY